MSADSFAFEDLPQPSLLKAAGSLRAVERTGGEPDNTDIPTLSADLPALADAAGRGDRSSFGALYATYQHDLRAFFLRRVGAEEDAEDLVGQTFYQALRGVERRDPSRPFNVWLFHIGANVLRDFFRRRGTRSTTARFSLDAQEEQPSVEEGVLESYLDERLDAALSKLTAKQRWVLQLRIVEDLSYGEVAERLGCNEGAVRALQMRALHSLRDALSGHTDRSTETA